MTVRIVIADDHRLVREALEALFARATGLEVVGLAEDGASAVRLVRQLAPDLLVTDVAMPGLNGIEAVRRARAEHAALRVLCISMHGDQRTVVAAIDAGACGYVLKDSSSEEAVLAVREVAAGRFHLGPTLMRLVVDEVRTHRHLLPANTRRPLLTDREREILQLFAEDLGSHAIADRLHLSIKTVSTHRENIVRKLGVRGIAGLTRYAVREGISPDELPGPR